MRKSIKQRPVRRSTLAGCMSGAAVFIAGLYTNQKDRSTSSTDRKPVSWPAVKSMQCTPGSQTSQLGFRVAGRNILSYSIVIGRTCMHIIDPHPGTQIQCPGCEFWIPRLGQCKLQVRTAVKIATNICDVDILDICVRRALPLITAHAFAKSVMSRSVRD